jgi:hypothetical protein
MRRFVIHLLALAGLASFAGTALAAPAAQPVELVAPRSGETLVAGTTAEIAWAPLACYTKLRGVEEWEAFLSLDGGATYPVRITPHLDQDLRRVSWQVPAIPTGNARLLLRFGDEQRETLVELPERFSIVASREATAPAALLETRAPDRGERARLDKDQRDAGVVAWVEGSRRGGALRQVVAVAPPGFQTRIQPAETHDEVVELAGGHSLPVPELSATLGAVPEAPPGARFAGPLDSHPFAFDLLLLTQRRNE